MENLLNEEEQISLLGKMLYYSANHLTARERETYDHLVESLLRKVQQLRAVNQRHRPDGHLPLSHSLSNKQHEITKRALRKYNPEKVCKVFVEAWNKQDFETEFFCLANCFPLRKKKTQDIQEYVLQRMSKYQDRLKVGPVSKKIVEITSAQAHGNKTSIYCIELHRMPDKKLTMHREYEFIFEESAWRIADYVTLKSRDVSSKDKVSA